MFKQPIGSAVNVLNGTIAGAFNAFTGGGTAGNSIPSPLLDLDFAGTGAVDSRVTFTRASSGTFINSAGLVATAATNAARITHEPVTLRRLGLLIEESRTNLFLRSEELDNAVIWIRLAASISANSAVSPNGATTADKIVEDSTNDVHYVTQTATVVSGTTYTLTAYAKADGRNWFCMGIIGMGVIGDVFFDLANGVVGNVKAGVTASIQSVGNGWYRCVVVGAATLTALQFYPQPRTSNGGGAYLGNGTSGILVWGAQLEAGAFATSYIPTTSAQVTRAADVATMTGTAFSNWYRQDQGTWSVQFRTPVALPGISGAPRVLGGNATAAPVALSSGSGGSVVSRDTTGAGASVTGVGAVTTVNAALAYSSGSGTMAANGVVGSASAYNASTLTTLAIGSDNGSGQFLSAPVARIRYWPLRLPNPRLAQLSS